MGTAFRRRGQLVSAGFQIVEVELLRSLVAQLCELLSDEQPTGAVASEDPLAELLDLASPERPSDPVLQRLFPDAYPDDESASEFRRYTERGLRDGKLRSAKVVLSSLAAAEPRKGENLRVRLDAADATAWLRTLTDLRLALATRLGVEDDDEPRWDNLPDDDPVRYVHDVYQWLGWVQETLVKALMPR